MILCGSNRKNLNIAALATSLAKKWKFTKRVLIVASILLGISLAGHGSQFENVFEIPQALTSKDAQARALVDQDLIQLQQLEVQNAFKQAPAGLIEADKARVASKIIQARNAKVISRLSDDLQGKVSGAGVSTEEADEIRAMFKTHPVVGDLATLRYDTPSRQIGYCFGRAAFAHWELLRRGVRPEDIAKIFAVGEMNYGSVGWKFHVATIVRNKEGGWIVIDALQTHVLPVVEWSHEIQKWSSGDSQPMLRFYVTDPIKLLPVPGGYSSKTLSAPYYKGFFRDLADWFGDLENTTRVKFSR